MLLRRSVRLELLRGEALEYVIGYLVQRLQSRKAKLVSWKIDALSSALSEPWH